MPGKPLNLTVSDIKDTTLLLHWLAPESDGGAEITGYIIEQRLENTVQWIKAVELKTPSLEAKIAKLKENSQYEFRVAAQNKVGTGPYSDPSTPVLVKETIGS